MAFYPTSIATDANLYLAVNGLQTTLAVSIGTGDTTIQLTSSTGFPAQGGEFFQRVPLDFLEGFRLVQQKYNFFGAERFNRQHVAEAKGHNYPRSLGRANQKSQR